MIRRFAAVAADLDPAARVPTCPDWSVADLTTHVGTVHRWAGNMVAVLAPERIPSSTMDLGVPDDPRERPAWLAAGADPLVETLRSRDPDAPMWAWGADKHVRFWPRRMVHETAVHLADAEFAAGIAPEVDAALAVDGIDEFLDNVSHAAYFAYKVTELRGNGERISFNAADAADAGARWSISLTPDGFSWDHVDADADVSVSGAAPDLYLMVWGRRRPDDGARFTVEGDRALLDRWVERSSL